MRNRRTLFRAWVPLSDMHLTISAATALRQLLAATQITEHAAGLLSRRLMLSSAANIRLTLIAHKIRFNRSIAVAVKPIAQSEAHQRPQILECLVVRKGATLLRVEVLGARRRRIADAHPAVLQKDDADGEDAHCLRHSLDFRLRRVVELVVD